MSSNEVRENAGDGQNRQGQGRSIDASAELAETLRSLDETMKQHMAALDRRRGEVLSAVRPPSAPPTQLAVPAAAAGPRPSVVSIADLPRSEKVRQHSTSIVHIR
jgi:hypothetical protein